MSVIKKDNNGNYTNYTGVPNANEGLPLGFIFASALPQTNSNYHLLNGDNVLIANYNEFYTLLTTLVNQSWNLTCTANEYAEDIAKTGNCGKFVINSTSSDITGTYDTTTITVNANSIKLPTITKFIQGVSSLTDLGNSVEAGLPNITGNIYKNDTEPISFKPANNITSSGALGITKESKGVNGGTLVSGYQGLTGITFDASQSNLIYGNSTEVQPNATQYPYYIVLKNNSNSGLMNYLITAGVQSLGSAVGDITLGDGLSITNNMLDIAGIGLVETYVSSDGKTFYRKYSDGFVIQGQYITPPSSSPVVVVFPVEMKDTNFTVLSTLFVNSANTMQFSQQGYDYTTTGYTQNTAGGAHFKYICFGYAKESE